MIDPFIDRGSKECPNCGKPYKADLSYCPHCGLGRKKLFSKSEVTMPLFPWKWILVTMIFVPLAAWGVCLSGTYNVHSDSAFYSKAGVAMTVQLVSILIGIAMLVANAIAAFRGKK